MKIVMIGSGNLATNLAKALKNAGNDIIQVVSRTMESASMLAKTIGASAITDISHTCLDADIYIFSVKDSVLESCIKSVAERVGHNKIMVHTAGSISMDVFSGHANRFGVFYPMQTFSKQRKVNFESIPVFIESSDNETLDILHNLANQITEYVYILDSEKRRHLHLSAVWACNFVNHCYCVAAKILEYSGLPFSVMHALIDETADKVKTMHPSDAQTGPAVRYDENVIAHQHSMMSDMPLQAELYDLMSRSIHQFSQEKEGDDHPRSQIRK